MAIQMRRGNAADYDEDKMLPGEFGVAVDDEELYIAFDTGNSKRVLTEDDIYAPLQNLWTGTCSTAGNTAAKVVTLDNPDGFELADGVTIAIHFTYASNVNSPTLNVNSTGNKAIYYIKENKSGQNVGSHEPFKLMGGGYHFFTYGNGHWYLSFPDTTTIDYILNHKANLASPALTGTPTAPTASVGTDTTQIATTAFVQDEIDSRTITATVTNGDLTFSLT